MKLKISYKNLKHSSAIDARIREKSEKLSKYFEGQINISWVCWVHADEHCSEIKVHGPGFDFFAKAFSDNMYKSLDLCHEKIEKQLDKQKDLYKNKIHNYAYNSPKYKLMKDQLSDELKFQERYIQELTG